LQQSGQCLKPGGRLCIITFHSLEDRLVKTYIKNGTLDEITTDAFGRRVFENPLIVKKDVIPSEEEIKVNSRSRSARLRIAEMGA